MKTLSHLKLPLIALAVAALAALLVWALSPVSVLEFRVGDDGPVVKSIQVTPGERLTYRYLHSIERGWIDEIMEVAPSGDLVVRGTVYDAAGRGIPSDMPDGDFSVDPETHRLRVDNMNRDLPSWPVRVAFTAQQTVQIGDESFRLDSLAPPTSLLTVAVATHPRLRLP